MIKLNLVEKEPVINKQTIDDLGDIVEKCASGEVTEIALVARGRDKNVWYIFDCEDYAYLTGAVERLRHKVFQEWDGD